MPTAHGKITLTVAKKIVANLVKGYPPLKPDHGEHGQCSWFVYSGNPYTGVSADKNIDVSVKVDYQHIHTNDKIVGETLASFQQHEMQLLETNRRQFDLKLWNAVGNEVRRSRPNQCSNILVPEGPVSRQGSGYFLVVPPFATRHVALVDADAFIKMDDTRSPGWFEVCSAAESSKNENLSASISIEIGPCQTERAIPPILAKVQSAVPAPAKFVPARTESRQIPVRSGWGGATRNAPRFFQTATLTYASYREARSAFKTLMGLAATLNSGGADATVLKVFGGQDWSAKQRSIYTAPEAARVGFG